MPRANLGVDHVLGSTVSENGSTAARLSVEAGNKSSGNLAVGDRPFVGERLAREHGLGDDGPGFVRWCRHLCPGARYRPGESIHQSIARRHHLWRSASPRNPL